MSLGSSEAFSPSLPNLHTIPDVKFTSDDAQDDSWTAGISLPADINTRCHSSLSTWSETSSPFPSRRRPASSLSALHEQSKLSSQQLHEFRLAAMSGNIDPLRKALDRGVCVDQSLRMGWTALMFAASSAQDRAVKFLLEKEANPNFHKELFTPLMAACASSASTNPPMENASQSSDSPASTGDGVAGSDRLLNCVQHLLNAGADINTLERHRMSALMFACKGGKTGIVRLLIKGGAQINMQDNKGWSALCWACQGGHSACVTLLLEATADASLETQQGQTAAEIARYQHFYGLAETVETAALGCPISAPAPQGQGEGGTVTPSPLPPSCSDLDMVLAGLDLSSLRPLFAKHKVDLAGFLRLSASELSTMGIEEVGVQHKLLTAIAEMHRKAWQPSSLAPLNCKPYISLVEATSMLCNVQKHLTFLEGTVAFLRQQLESSPSSHHLHQHTTDHNINTLIDTAEETNQAIGRLAESTKYLSGHLRKLSTHPSHIPADVLVSPGPDAPLCWSRASTVAAVATGAAIAAIWWLRPGVFALPVYSRTVLLDC